MVTAYRIPPVALRLPPPAPVFNKLTRDWRDSSSSSEATRGSRKLRSKHADLPYRYWDQGGSNAVRRTQGRPCGVLLHRHLRLRRPRLRRGLQQTDWRRAVDAGRTSGGRCGARLCTIRGGCHQCKHFRRSREPSGDLRPLPRRKHHPLPRHPLLGGPTSRRRRRLSPPPLHNRPRHRHLRPHRHRLLERARPRDRPDFRPGVHSLRHGGGPEEGTHRNHRPPRHRLHRRRQHPRRRRLRRRVHEPRHSLRAGARQLEVDPPLDLLGRSAYRRRARRNHLRASFHQPHTRAASFHRLLIWLRPHSCTPWPCSLVVGLDLLLISFYLPSSFDDEDACRPCRLCNEPVVFSFGFSDLWKIHRFCACELHLYNLKWLFGLY